MTRLGYLYRHIRNDTNEVFYIGIGFDKNFARSRNTFNRNNIWKNIVGKTSYTIEILMTGVEEHELYRKEREFIKLYGRRDLKLGTLCNLTDGDVGCFGCRANVGRKRSSEFKEKLRKAHTGKKLSLEHREKMRQVKLNMSIETRQKMSEAKKGIPFRLGKYKSKVIQMDKNGHVIRIWDGAFQAAREKGFDRGHIGKCCAGHAKHHKGYIWKYLQS